MAYIGQLDTSTFGKYAPADPNRGLLTGFSSGSKAVSDFIHDRAANAQNQEIYNTIKENKAYSKWLRDKYDKDQKSKEASQPSTHWWDIFSPDQTLTPQNQQTTQAPQIDWSQQTMAGQPWTPQSQPQNPMSVEPQAPIDWPQQTQAPTADQVGLNWSHQSQAPTMAMPFKTQGAPTPAPAPVDWTQQSKSPWVSSQGTAPLSSIIQGQGQAPAGQAPSGLAPLSSASQAPTSQPAGQTPASQSPQSQAIAQAAPSLDISDVGSDDLASANYWMSRGNQSNYDFFMNRYQTRQTKAKALQAEIFAHAQGKIGSALHPVKSDADIAVAKRRLALDPTIPKDVLEKEFSIIDSQPDEQSRVRAANQLSTDAMEVKDQLVESNKMKAKEMEELNKFEIEQMKQKGETSRKELEIGTKGDKHLIEQLNLRKSIPDYLQPYFRKEGGQWVTTKSVQDTIDKTGAVSSFIQGSNDALAFIQKAAKEEGADALFGKLKDPRTPEYAIVKGIMTELGARYRVLADLGVPNSGDTQLTNSFLGDPTDFFTQYMDKESTLRTAKTLIHRGYNDNMNSKGFDWVPEDVLTKSQAGRPATFDFTTGKPIAPPPTAPVDNKTIPQKAAEVVNTVLFGPKQSVTKTNVDATGKPIKTVPATVKLNDGTTQTFTDLKVMPDGSYRALKKGADASKNVNWVRLDKTDAKNVHRGLYGIK